MATVLLKVAGTAIGTAIGGPLGGKIGGAVGAMVGSMVDQSVINSLKPVKNVYGPQINNMALSAPRDGEPIARVYGWARCSARPMWPSDLEFVEVETVERTGGKGVVQPRVNTYTYANTITAVFAVCMGPNAKFRRMWVDGTEINPNDYGGFEWFEGNADQEQLEAVAAVEGIDNTPDFAGIAGFVLTDWSTNDFGNRVPQITVEVYRAIPEARGPLSGVCLKPGGNEYALEPEIVVAGDAVQVRTYDISTDGAVYTTPDAPSTEETEDDTIDEARVNTRENALQSDVMAALDVLALEQPALETITICLPWYGTDLRCGQCEIKPGVTSSEINPSIVWQVGAVDRTGARVVPTGGTPCDASVVRLISLIKSRGYGVTVLPLVEMDISEGNGLFDPYGGVEQSAYPDRGAITCDPAPGQPGTVDNTSGASAQVDAFFGAVLPSDFAVVGGEVLYSGSASDWGLRRFIFHCASVAIAAGGVDSFAISSGLSGITTIRDDAGNYPAIPNFLEIAGELRAAFDAVRVDFWGANWGDKVTHRISNPGDGVSLPLIAQGALPVLPEWRIASYLLLSASAVSYSNAGGSGFPYDGGIDGYFIKKGGGTYAADLVVDIPIAAPGSMDISVEFQHGRWGWIVEASRNWSIDDYDSSGGFIKTLYNDPTNYANVYASNVWKDDASGLFAADVEGDYIRFSYQFGYPEFVFRDLVVEVMERRHVALTYVADWLEYGAHIPDDGTGDVSFPLDDLWASAVIDFVGINYFAPLSDNRQDGEISGVGEFPGAGPDVGSFKANVEAGEFFDYSYADYQDRIASVKTPIDDLTYSKPWVFRAKDLRGWWKNQHHARVAGVENVGSTPWVPESKPIVFCAFGAAHLDNAANQPSAMMRPYLADQALPYFSTGARDDDAPAFYAQALLEYWQENEPGMVDLGRSCVWYWDSRPWPDLGETDVYNDSAAWSKSHAISGRPVVTISKLIASEAAYFGLEYSIGELPGAIYGAQVDNVSGFSEVVNAYTAPFFVDGFESAGEMRFTSRLIEPVAAELGSMGLVPLSEGRRFERLRKSADEVPQAMWLSYQSPVHDYGSNSVHSIMPGGASRRQESFTIPAVLDEELAAQRVGSIHVDQEVARESISFKVEKGRFTEFEPGNIINIPGDMGGGQAVVLERTLGVDLEVMVQSFDRSALLPLPVTVDLKKVSAPALSFSGRFFLMDLPLIREGQAAHDAFAAAAASPWNGWSVYRSTRPQIGYKVLAQLGTRAIAGVTTAAIAAGPETVFDRGNALYVKLYSGELISRPDSELFQGENSLALEVGLGEWEIVQFGEAELVDTRKYKLTRLLRGRRDTLQADSLPAGARVVILDGAVTELGLTNSKAGVSCYITSGPSNKDRSDASYIEKEHYFSRRGQRPFSPANLAGGLDAAGGLSLQCVRRDRALDAVDWNTGPVPMSEAVEAYEWEVEGQVFETALPELALTSGELSSAGIAAPFTVAVYQVSEVVGRGRAASIDIT